jgi:hypothetical protein
MHNAAAGSHGRYLDAEAVREQMAPSHAPDVAESVMYRQALAALEAALVALPERSRKAFVAHRVHGVRQPEIAARLGVSLNTVERDLIQANACIEDVLHRWRGSSPAVRSARAMRGGAAAWAPCWDWRAWGWAGLPPGGSGCCIARPMCSGRPAGAAHAASRCATACPTARTCCWMRPAVPGAVLRGAARGHARPGAAFFEVARDERPFTVDAAGVRVTVLGTRFGVDIEEGQGGQRVSVQVASGRVQVQTLGADARAWQTHELGAGQGLRLERGAVVRTQAASGDAAAWRHGELVFADTTLGEALQRLGRYAPFELQATPEAARLPLSGRVRIAQAHAWVRALPRALPVQVRQQPGGGLLLALAP